MSRRERLFWLCVGFVFFVGFLALIPSHYEICEVAEKTKEQQCTAYRMLPFVIIKIGKILDFTAIGTLVIAAFTGTLWWSTRGMQRATIETIKLARDEFISTHRPKLIVRDVHAMLEGTNQNPVGQRLMVQYEIANTGDTDAKIVGTSMVIAFLNGGRLANEHAPSAGEFAMPGLQSFVLKPGFCLNQVFGNPEGRYDDYHFREYDEQHGLFFIGHVLYEDDLGNQRRTSFCRRYHHLFGYWPATEYYDYEHVD